MTIGEIISKFPETINVFFEHGLHCVGCAGAAFETLEQGAEMHGVDSDKLVAELNDLVYKIQQIQKKDKLNTSKNLK
ncbi:DUF1858 domain-containing protein [Candidatus Woesearchaeota archaeon]|nr:DUF1858 domain-containing protein [Candidatus Woesearchaeota archaeon]